MLPHRMLTVLAVGLTALLVSGPAAAAPSTTEIKPGALPQGADVAIPHLEGRTVVDGDVRIPVAGRRVRLLGTSGASYVVGVVKDDGFRGTVSRLAADGTLTKIARSGSIEDVVLSRDGASVVVPGPFTSSRNEVRVLSVGTGELVAKRTFAGYPHVMDARNATVLVGSFERGTLAWNTTTDKVRLVSERAGGAADLSSGLFASYTGDPYDGGCTVVAKVSTPEQALWTSCTERVEAFAPGGRRMVTVHILSDGIGPSQASVRTLEGKLAGRYEVRGWFGVLTFENPKALLLDTNGKRQSTTVRCVRDVCERAADLKPTQAPRVG